jgi:hypothetical protein
MKKKQRRLPNGKYTDDLDTYLDAWKQLAQPIIDKTGWQLTGFDPDFQFVKENKLAVTLPLWAVVDLTK